MVTTSLRFLLQHHRWKISLGLTTKSSFLHILFRKCVLIFSKVTKTNKHGISKLICEACLYDYSSVTCISYIYFHEFLDVESLVMFSDLYLKMSVLPVLCRAEQDGTASSIQVFVLTRHLVLC